MLLQNPGQRVSLLLKAVAVLQGLDGFIIAGGCMCAPSLRGLGVAIAALMAVVVTSFLLAAFRAVRHPRWAGVVGVILQGLLLGALLLPGVGPPLASLYVQVLCAILVVAALVVSRTAPAQKR